MARQASSISSLVALNEEEEWPTEDSLAAHDAEGYAVINALAHEKAAPIPSSHASPHCFACDDGAFYWVKRSAQQGLGCELISGRLAALVGAGPGAVIVDVPATSLPNDGSANHLLGLGVGFSDQPGTINTKECQQLTGNPIDAATVDSARHALVAVFYSWIGVGDAQALIDLSTGRLYGIDYGDSLPDPHAITPPVQSAIAGMPGGSHSQADLDSAIATVEAVTNADLLQAVARMPTAPDWQADSQTRCQVARWLANRRDSLRSALIP